MDIATLLIYYSILAVSFSISTYMTYVRPSIKLARTISNEEDNVLGTNAFSFLLQYIFYSTITFPVYLFQILLNDPEAIQDRMVEILLEEE